MALKIKYNTPIEVTEKQYRALLKEADGIVAGQESNGKFFIKVWLMKYTKLVREIISDNE